MFAVCPQFKNSAQETPEAGGKMLTVLDLSEDGIAGSNPTRGVYVFSLPYPASSSLPRGDAPTSMGQNSVHPLNRQQLKARTLLGYIRITNCFGAHFHATPRVFLNILC
jgi:hypothetical protein